MKSKKTDTVYRKKLMRLMSAYAIIMLLILITAVTSSREQVQDVSDITTASTAPTTEYVYITQDIPYHSIQTEEATQKESYILKEYMEKIGIFSSDGTLIKTLDVYIKTLPEADRRLLREGIEVSGKQELNAIIEDYTS